jgi:hypothetical protein
VPDDLLRHVIGPTPYSSWWLWIALLLTLALIGWYVAVFVGTRPGRQPGDLPVIGATRDALIKWRFARAVHAIGVRHRAGELAAAPAAMAVSHELRVFLRRVTGVRAEYMQVDSIAQSEIGSAAAVLADLTDAQFNAASTVDVGSASDTVEELIRSWS